MSTRVSSAAIAVPTEAQAREALGKYITAHLEVEKIEVQTTKKVEELKATFAASSKPFEEAQEAAEEVLKAYSDGHPELFAKRQKTEVYGGHKIGYQKTKLAARLLGEQTWEGFTAAALAVGDWAMNLLRTKYEADKAKIAAYWLIAAEQDRPALVEKLAKLGVVVEGGKRFVVDLNLQPKAPQA